MEDIIQLIHKNYIQYLGEPIALLRWHCTKRSFYADWIRLDYLAIMVQNITYHNELLFKKTLHTNFLRNIYYMKDIYNILLTLDKIINIICKCDYIDEYYHTIYTTKYTVKDILETLRHKNLLLKVDAILKERYGWQIIIEANYGNQLKNDTLLDASVHNKFCFTIYNKKNDYINLK